VKTSSQWLHKAIETQLAQLSTNFQSRQTKMHGNKIRISWNQPLIFSKISVRFKTTRMTAIIWLIQNKQLQNYQLNRILNFWKCLSKMMAKSNFIKFKSQFWIPHHNRIGNRNSKQINLIQLEKPDKTQYQRRIHHRCLALWDIRLR
jgi:hypothetical protein